MNDDDGDDGKDSDADQDDGEHLLVFSHCSSQGQLPPFVMDIMVVMDMVARNGEDVDDNCETI